MNEWIGDPTCITLKIFMNEQQTNQQKDNQNRFIQNPNKRDSFKKEYGLINKIDP